MTTARRITISEQTVLMALAEWHARYSALPEPARAQCVADNERATSGEFAAATSGFLFALLERHAEATA
jgi:hypothetical protein